MKIHISKTSIAFLDESDMLLEECNNNISSSRILVQNIDDAEAFFKELIKKHCRSIIRPKITLVADDTIFEDKITQVEERAIFGVLYRAGARRLIYRETNVKHNESRDTPRTSAILTHRVLNPRIDILNET